MDEARTGSRTSMSPKTDDHDSGSTLSRLLDCLHDVVWTATPDGSRVLYISDACQTVYGRAADEFRRDPSLTLEVVHPNDIGIAAASLTSVIEHGNSAVEYRIVRPDGTIRWISDHKTLVRDEDGAVLFLGGVIRDITGHGRAKQFIEAQQRLMEGVVSDRPLATNLEALCRAVDELVPNASSSVLLFDDDRQKLRLAAAPGLPDALKAMLDGIVPREDTGSCGVAATTGEAVFVSDTKSDPRWTELQHLVRDFNIKACWSMPIHSADGSVLGAFAVSSYVERYPSQSDRHLLEMASQSASIACQCQAIRQSLSRVKSEAEQEARRKAAFLADVSHELRTPLTSVLGFAETLLEDSAVRAMPAARQDDLRTIQRNGAHLLELVNNLLDMSKIEFGQLQIERLPCSPVDLVQQTVASLRRAAEENGLTLEFEYTPPVAPRILTDPTRLRQILYNLIGNAVKFTSDGGVRVRLTCQIERQVACLRVDVIDSGIGLTADQIERVFRPFAQAETSTAREYGGTGLGLSVCRQLAELLGGRISVESIPQQGSTFTVHLEAPVLDAEPAAASTASDQQTQHPTSPLAGGRAQPMLSGRFLVVDDSPDILRLVEVVLARAGAVVDTAPDGAEACQLARRAEKEGQPFTAVLLDMQMPNMDGYTTTRQLRAGGYTCPIVALTARCTADDREQSLRAGCDYFVTKPIDQSELLSLLTGIA